MDNTNYQISLSNDDTNDDTNNTTLYENAYKENYALFEKTANTIKTQTVLSASFVLIGWVIFFIGIIVFVTNLASNAESYDNYLDGNSYGYINAADSYSGVIHPYSSNVSVFSGGAIAGLVIYVIGILFFIGAYIGILINSIIMYTKDNYKITNNASEGVKVGLIVSNVLVFFFPVIGAILFIIFVVASSNTKTDYFNKQVIEYTNKKLQKPTIIINQ